MTENLYSAFDPIIGNVKDPTLKAILKYEKYPSILAIQHIHGKNFQDYPEW